MDLAVATAVRIGADYLLVSEPNIRAVKGRTWHHDQGLDAAIGHVGNRSQISRVGKGNGFLWADIRGLTVYSCYISPNVSTARFEVFLDELAADLRRKGPRKLIVTGDFNAKSPDWGAHYEDNRGRLLAEVLASFGLTAMNQEGVLTFYRRGSGSTIDVTAVSEEVVGSIRNWRVLEDEESLSPHRYIAFEVASIPKPKDIWQLGPINEPRLRRYLDQVETQHYEKTPREMVDLLSRAYRNTTDRVRTIRGGTPYWWTEEISSMRKVATAYRRRLTRAHTRAADDDAVDILSQEYKAAKKTLRQAINKSKKRCWSALLADLENDVYGEGFKIVTRALKVPHPPLTLSEEETRQQIDKLFPLAPHRRWDLEDSGQIPPLREEEVEAAAGNLKSGKSPGPDGVPAEVVKIAVSTIGSYVLGVLEALWQEGNFPKEWKVTKVVLIPKPTKTPAQERSYRPICLVNTCAKLFEQVIKSRLETEIEERGGLADNQFGFRRGRSTLEAVQLVLDHAVRAHGRNPSEWCTMAAMDVRNAFNTADWEAINNALETKGVSAYLRNMVKNYLSDRSIMVGRGGELREVNVGVPQGSIMGPLLWNIMYDGLLRIELPEGVDIIGFADDIALVGRDKDWSRVESKMEQAMNSVSNWLTACKLSVAPEKTEAVALKFRRRNKDWSVTLLGQPVNLSSQVKYLGIVLDRSVSFGPHIRMAAAKAERTANALTRLMPNIGGPGERKRRVLGSAVHSILLYGAPVWAQAMSVASYRRIYQSTQRKLGLRICRAYRTTSYEATMVVASLIPIHLLADERRRIWLAEPPRTRAKKVERESTLRKWQEEWVQGAKGAWTRRLIQDLRPWILRKHGEVGYYLTQALTGHGCFKSYTHRIGKTDEFCSHCGAPDTAEHTLFICSAYEPSRSATHDQIGARVTPENLVAIMLTSEANWRLMETHITAIMKDKEQREGA